jgi:hypothetical protein
MGLEQLRELNDIQDRVCSYIVYALGPDEDARFPPIVARLVLERRDPYLRAGTWAVREYRMDAAVTRRPRA